MITAWLITSLYGSIPVIRIPDILTLAYIYKESIIRLLKASNEASGYNDFYPLYIPTSLFHCRYF